MYFVKLRNKIKKKILIKTTLITKGKQKGREKFDDRKKKK